MLQEPTNYEMLPAIGLQHLAFCPRQRAFILLEQAWAENRLNADGRLLHERADHSGQSSHGTVRNMGRRSFSLESGVVFQDPRSGRNPAFAFLRELQVSTKLEHVPRTVQVPDFLPTLGTVIRIASRRLPLWSEVRECAIVRREAHQALARCAVAALRGSVD